MYPDNIFSVCLITFNQNGDILAVSRKNNHHDMCLPGGKIDIGETTEESIFREVKEETGLDIINLKFQFIRDCPHLTDQKPCVVFTGDVIGQINYEPHVFKWVKPIIVTQGSFGEFTSSFNKLNIKF